MVYGGLVSNLIGYAIYGSIGLSTVITLFNNASSNSRIKRKGYKIKPITANSIFENIKYFVKDYLFLFIPLYNIIKSIKKVAQKDSEFDSERIAILSDRDRLESVKKAPKKEEPKKEEPKKEEPKKEVPQQQVVPNRGLTPQITSRAARASVPTQRRQYDEDIDGYAYPTGRQPEEGMDCYERREHLRNEYYRLKQAHAQAKAAGRDVLTLNDIAARMRVVVNEYNKAIRACQIEDLKRQRNMIVSRSERPATLIRS